MGYCIKMTDSNFAIKKEDFFKALENLKSVFVPENMTCKNYISGKEYPHFSWVDTKTVIESMTLEEALIKIRYKPVFNKNGDIMNVVFTGEKDGDEEVFFPSLAPYVEDGSYICFEREDGTTWKWLFENGEVKQC